MSNNYLITPEQEGERLDSLLTTLDPSQSRGYFQKIIEKGSIVINGKAISKPSYKVKKGDSISVPEPAAEAILTAKPIPLEILYEDEDILVINKPANMIVHPTQEEHTETVAHALLHHDPKIAHAVHDKNSAVSRMRPGIVHRLDKDTSGVLIIAKTADSLEKLSDQFRKHTAEKTYLTLVVGIAKKETVETGMARKALERAMMGVTKNGEGREAITHFKPIAKLDYFGQPLTLLECEIETGRTHQIRVHCKFRGHAVVGDTLYTNPTAKKLSERLGATRQMLHAKTLTIVHPTTNQKMTFTAKLPDDFNQVLTKLGAPDSLNIRG
ncbi:MAG: pseudouridine synthase, RluA family protein [Patescibacteria group bacterium]|jgi:23S rRNA pseudouridine1911/1915/1917 synthase|nr:pseudouridine synthase, RluA family protein [Patescibacteria group bacterium]